MKLTLTSIDFAVFAVYLLAVVFLGVYATRHGQRTKRDYFLAGDKLPWWMIGGSIVAANISSHHLVGVMGTAYKRGFVAVTIEWGAILIGFNALLWIFLPFYLRNGFYTMPEFLQRRFGGAARTTYAALVLATYIFVEIAAVLYFGALALFALTSIPMTYSILVLAVATGAYTIAGGFRAVIWTEMLQLVVLLLGSAVLSFLTIQQAGGLSAVMETSPDWHLLLPSDDPDFPWTMYLGGILCISVFYCAANQFIVQRVLAAKNEWHARLGVVFALYLKFLMPLLIIVPGLVAPRLFPDLERSDLVFPTLVEHLLPTGLVGLVMAGLIAAVMSHISGAVNSCTTIATVDFYLPFIRKNATEVQAVRFGRLFGVAVLAISIACAEMLIQYSDRPVFLYLFDAYGYFCPGIATMFLLGILWKRTTHAGALTAGLMTIPLSAAMQYRFPDLPFMNRSGIVFWTCMATCIAVSLVTKPKPMSELEGLIWNKESLEMPPQLRAAMRGLRRPGLWWAVVTLMVLYFYFRYP
ncbi:MAG: sodium/solute symporter [Planctomycetota bacterium]